ncbi:MAG: beta-lactamase family protein [Nitrospinae bacterium]|nr:beta-lactamase family protein [Nitrospinota bacterium]
MENKIQTLLHEAVPNATEGIQLQYIYKGSSSKIVNAGKTYLYYDWASLTKVVFTVTCLMKLYEEKAFAFEDKVSSFIPDYPWDIQLYQLLTHSSGLPGWLPIYKQLGSGKQFDENWKNLRDIIFSISPENKETSEYSDIGFLLLGFFIETITGKPLIEHWKIIAKSLGMNKTFFHENNIPFFPKDQYAPTEDCPLRKKIIQGEINDENCWYLGGVASHAGLFGPIEDLERWAKGFRDTFFGKKNDWIVSTETVKTFAQRAIPSKTGDWTYGFMMPTKGKASCGSFFSPVSLGHLGFTGCSFWFDPKVDLVVLIVTNRTFPSRENKEFIKYRPKIHDLIYKLLTSKNKNI